MHYFDIFISKMRLQWSDVTNYKTEVPDPLVVEDLNSDKLNNRRKLARLIKQYRDIFRQIYICYLPGGRAVWEKTVPLVLSTARGRRPRAVLKTKGTVFSHTDRPSPVNNIFIFFLQ